MNGFFIPNDIREITDGLSDCASLLEGKTIILTGGRGFLGRYFVEVFRDLNQRVLKKPCKIIVFDNLITAGKTGEAIQDLEGVQFLKQDVIQPFTYDGPVDYILHAAGIASPYYYRAYPLETLDVAITGTRNALELARKKHARFVFFSSSEIYGNPDPANVPTTESYNGYVSCLGARACYDESKRVGETLCTIYHGQFGVHTNMIRPFNVFGPGMQESDYRVLPNFASRIAGKRPLKIYGDGTQTRTFCYITDAINGFIRVMVKGVAREPYNIGNPTPEISMVDLVKEIEKIKKTPVQLDLIAYPDSYPADEPLRRCPDIKKAKLQLNYAPQVSLQEGLSRFLSWTTENYTGQQ